MDIEVCPRCLVPIQFVNIHEWTGGGTIVQSNDPEHRMVLIECDNIDPLFKEIETLIGMPIERIVIESKRRDAARYMNRVIPPDVKEKVQSLEMDIVPLIDALNLIGFILGYGNSKLVRVEYVNSLDDYVIERIREPYSIPFWCADLAGSSEVVTSRDHDVKYEMIAEDEVEIKAWPSPRPRGLTSRLELKEYPYVEGDLELEKCPECGGPVGLRGYAWSPDRGVIQMKSTGRRVVMIGPSYLNAVFRELEAELGEDIPRIVVEAQRIFTKQDVYSQSEIGEMQEFRKLLGLRGFGNLRELKMQEKALKVTIENAAIPLLLVGLLQGYFEDVTGLDSHADWEVGEEGTLRMEISPKN
jgi:hypothetical protein